MERYPLSLHDALPIFNVDHQPIVGARVGTRTRRGAHGPGTADSGLFGSDLPAWGLPARVGGRPGAAGHGAGPSTPCEGVPDRHGHRGLTGPARPVVRKL